MSKRANPTVIGVFVLVALALVATAILTLGRLQLFTDATTRIAFFDGDVGGPAVGSPVLFRGAQVGQVTTIKIAFDPTTGSRCTARWTRSASRRARQSFGPRKSFNPPSTEGCAPSSGS